MSKIVEGSLSIYDALKNIENYKYVMPAFQRQYVWSIEQIEKLWDSILLDYPISTFLFWHIDETNVTNDTYFCSFLKEVTFDSRKQADSVNYDLTNIDVDITDTAILDGQQRLTSLYLSLFGEAHVRPKHSKRSSACGIYTKLLIELNKEKLMVNEEEYNSKKYDIIFSDKLGKSSSTQFEIRNSISPSFKDPATRDKAIEDAISRVPKSSLEYARNLLNKLCSKIYDEKLIRYTEIRDMKQDDALEMFVRFNSGGKVLKKSEITMSILEAYWPNAKSEFGRILCGSFENFGTDFVIRSALMLYGDVIKSNINKNVVDQLRNNWSDFKNAFTKLSELIKAMQIDITRFYSSWNVLLPILYVVYCNPYKNYCEDYKSLKAYLVRAVLFTYFQSGTTNKLQQMRKYINENDYEITLDMLNQIMEFRVNDGKIDDILNSEKGSRIAGEALYYLSSEWLKPNIRYDQDHLHPFERFNSSKPYNISMTDWTRWRSERNKLPNLHLLSSRSNESKSDMSLEEYYNQMPDAYKEEFCIRSFIPQNVSLEFDNFDEFYSKRKELLTEKLKEVLN